MAMMKVMVKDYRVVGRARDAFEPTQDVLPDLKHGDVLDKNDAHDHHREEGLLKLGLADEPELAGRLAHLERNSAWHHRGHRPRRGHGHRFDSAT